MMTAKLAEILSWYRSESNGVLKNLYTILTAGGANECGKMVVLSVDQGFEHGPLRSFLSNPDAFNPAYHFDLGLEAGCNALAAPAGQIAAAAREYAGRIPLIVKVNANDSLYAGKDFVPAVTCSIVEAMRLGASAIGMTIHPGGASSMEMYEQAQEIGDEARSYGLPLVIWSYPRGEGLDRKDETGVDVVAYAGQIACQLGAHIVNVKIPTSHIAQEAAEQVVDREGLGLENLSNRVRLVVQSCFGGKRLVIFSGGEKKSDLEVLEEVRSLVTGGASGSIIGRNAFQRSRAEGVGLLRQVMAIYKEWKPD